MSLAGTLRNCAGGPTPWGSWLTCEETVARAGQAGNQRDHGWVFEVPATAEVGLADPQPIKAMGRFNHEAVAVDPRTGVIYLTEDRGDGLVYRFIPTAPGDLLKGGRLEALAVRGEPGFDTRNWKRQAIRPGEAVEVEWIPMDGTDAPEDDLRFRGVGAGAAPFARGEGIAWGEDAAYIVCTSGGAKRRGQVFRYRPSEHEGTPAEVDHPGTLSLFIEPEDADVVDMPDNVCVAPWGDLILCEDGPGEQGLVGVTPQGQLYRFARNARSNSEFAGACFSPDGSTMFVNIQHDGLTIAVTGPWA
jgi:secreted PhoX family phosphatase